MNLTLLVENSPRLRAFYGLNLSTWLGLEAFAVASADAAFTELKVRPYEFRLIIVRNRIGKEATAKLILEFLKTQNLNIPVIVLGANETAGQLHVPNSLDLKALVKTAASALNITAKEMSAKVVPDFYPIQLSFFGALKKPICNVYARQGKELKLSFEPGQEINPQALDALELAGHKELFVNKLDRLTFVADLSNELISTLQHEELSDDERVTANEKTVEVLSKKLLTLGITEETVSLAKKSMDSMRQMAKTHPKLSRLMERLLSNKASYLYKHTQILTYVALHIVHNMDWGSPDQEEKIAFIAFFHDIALDSDAQAQINSANELRRADLSPESKALVERHAQLAAELVSKYPHAPMGADQIIRQHHGQLNGIGFSEHYGANVSPMSVVLIVAEEFTRIILKQEAGPFKKEDMLKDLKAEFSTSRFSKVIEKLQTLML